MQRMPVRHLLLAPLGGVLLLLGSLFLMHLGATPGARAEGPDYPTTTMAAIAADTEPAMEMAFMSAIPCQNGTAGGFPCLNVDLMAALPLATIGGGLGNDLWGWTDPQTGKEYALMGRTNGTSFVDISNPEAPIYLGNLPSHTGDSIWRDIKVYQNHAFIVADFNGEHGVQVFDLTQLRNVPTPPVTFAETAHYGYIGSAHNIAINEETGFAYAVGGSSGMETCNGGLHMINIQTPVAPTFAGCFSADGYTHDAQCVIYQGPDTEHLGKEICFNANEDTVTIVDVTNKANPIQLARSPYAGSAYTHQGWLTEDQRYFLQDDELDEQSYGHNTRTYIWDMLDLNAPVLIGTYTAPVPAIDHNLYIKDGYAYEANYRSGMRILDISDVANGNLTEVAYFDVYPPDDSPSFNGAWTAYPYFASGNVIISGREQGLFVVRPNLGAPTAVTVSNLNSQAPTGWPVAALVVGLLAGAGAAGLAWRRRR